MQLCTFGDNFVQEQLSLSCLLGPLCVFRNVACNMARTILGQFLDELPSRVRLNASTLEFTIFTNCMDSHLWFDDERVNAIYEDWRRI